MFSISDIKASSSNHLAYEEAVQVLMKSGEKRADLFMSRDMAPHYHGVGQSPFFRISGKDGEHVWSPFFRLSDSDYGALVSSVPLDLKTGRYFLAMRHCDKALTYTPGVMSVAGFHKVNTAGNGHLYRRGGEVNFRWVHADLQARLSEYGVSQSVVFSLTGFEDRAGYLHNALCGFTPLSLFRSRADALAQEVERVYALLTTPL